MYVGVRLDKVSSILTIVVIASDTIELVLIDSSIWMVVVKNWSLCLKGSSTDTSGMYGRTW